MSWYKHIHNIEKYSKTPFNIYSKDKIINELIKEVEEKTKKLSILENEKKNEEKQREKPRKKTKKDMLIFKEEHAEEYMNYLRSLLVVDVGYKPLGKFDDETLCLETVKCASIQIKQNKASVFGDCITFGCMLKWVYFKLGSVKKFENWLKENTDISLTQSKKYQKLVPLSQYTKFYQLSVEFTNIYDQVDKIVTYIGCNEKERNFWE